MAESERKIIEILEGAGPKGVIQAEIYKALGLSKSWVSEILSSMERRGLIVRTRGPGKTLVVKLSKYADPASGRTIVVGLVPSIEYLPLPIMVKKLGERGYRIEPSLRRSVVDVAIGFMRGEFHIAYIPIYTLAVMRQLGAEFKILGAVALGGASIVGYRAPEVDKIFTSMLSTMEVLAMAYLRTHGLDHAYTKYYRDPRDVVETISKDHRSMAVLWEPYSLIAEAEGLRRTPLSSIIGDYHCCLLIARGNMHPDIIELIANAHRESIETLGRNIELASQLFSRIVGIEPHIIVKASNEYKYTYHIDKGLLRNIASHAKGPLTNIEILENLVSQNAINT
ncbi:MAG: MarR family transcriptional regulator [Sulfolobales archaeon]